MHGKNYETKSQAFEKLKFYQNLCEIRKTIFQIIETFPKANFKLIAQMRDCARSAKQNIREGYSKDSAAEFGRFIKISRGSLNELDGDVDDCHEDSLISKGDFLKVKD